MDAFKRATLLTTQAGLGLITSDEVRTEMKNLIPQMQADPESQPDSVKAESEESPPRYPTQGY